MATLKLTFLLLVCIVCANCKMPSYVTRCKRGDEKCLGDNANAVLKYLRENAGDSALKLQDTSKIFVKRMYLAANPELAIVLINTTIGGIDGCTVKSIKLIENELVIALHIEKLALEGAYELKGKLLLLPIEGIGQEKLAFIDFDAIYSVKLKIEERKGKKYYRIDSTPEDSFTDIKRMGNASYYFGNLFGGDPQLGTEMNKFLNDNWEDIYIEVRKAVAEGCTFHIFNPYLNGYLRRIPIDELFEP